MAITRWRPVRDLVNLQDEMNRLFDGFFGRPMLAPDWGEREWNPSVDVSETGDKILITADLPGMTKDDVKISVRDHTLTLEGEKKRQKEEKGKNYHRLERSYGSFCRSFTLPAAVKADKIKATYKDGVLSVELPKVEEAKPKEIPITAE
jgi:HSP20 family protein